MELIQGIVMLYLTCVTLAVLLAIPYAAVIIVKALTILVRDSWRKRHELKAVR